MNGRLVLAVIGAVLIDGVTIKVVFLPLYHRYKEITRIYFRGIIVKGVIVDKRSKEDLDQHTQFAPVVQFFSRENTMHIIESDHFSMIRPRINAEIEVAYEEGYPEFAIINPGQRWVLQLFVLIMVIGALLGVSAGVIYQCS